MKCLIVDTMHHSIIPMLESIGWEAEYQPEINRAGILDIIQEYHGLVIRSKTWVDQEFINRCRNLKFIARAGAGMDKLDAVAIEKAGIEIFNAPEGNRNAVAEHTLGLILGLLNNFVKADLEIRNRNWDREGNRGEELTGKTVGLLGYGYMGMAVAEKLKMMGCRVLSFDKYRRDYSDTHAVESDMDQLHQESDIFSIHVPLTSETKGLVSRRYLSKFKKPIFVVNTARGGILNLQDLLQCIEDGLVRGAALDVLENENLEKMSTAERSTFEKLIDSHKVILTPHVAGWTMESYIRINEVLVQKINELFRGIN